MKIQNDSGGIEMADQSKYLYLFFGLAFYYLSLFNVNKKQNILGYRSIISHFSIKITLLYNSIGHLFR